MNANALRRLSLLYNDPEVTLTETEANFIRGICYFKRDGFTEEQIKQVDHLLDKYSDDFDCSEEDTY